MAALCQYFRIGRIVRPHGVNGAVKLEPMSDELSRYKGLKQAFLERNGLHEPISVSDVGVKEGAVYMSLSCSSSREDAEALRGAFVCVDRAHAVKLPKDTYFVEDLIGCNVIDDEGRSLGTLMNVIETGANDVYEISGERKLLCPALKKVVADVNIPGREIVLRAKVLEEVGLFED